MDLNINKNTRVINIIGGPGIGKTTISALLFARLKMEGYVCEYVQEYAKRLVWTKNYDKLNNQYFVTKKQYELLKEIRDNHIDFIITDGPLLHGIYYNKNNVNNTSDIEKTEKYILNCYKDFDNINIMLQRVKRGNEMYEQEGRIQTEDEAKIIDEELKKILIKENISYELFSADNEAVDKILRYILEIIKK